MLSRVRWVDRAILGVFAATGLVACAEPAPTAVTSAADELGIARFATTDTPLQTTVIGLSADGTEIGRLELIHGVFTLTGPFRDDYDTATVDGRSLDVRVNGHAMHWEGAGYEPLLAMPAIPSSEAMLADFVTDPHVKPVLDRWQLGFESTQADETSYLIGYRNFAGTLVASCNGQLNCGPSLVRTGTGAGTYSVGTCGGGVATLTGNRITEASLTTEDLVSQCCPNNSGGNAYPWWGYKECPKVNNSTSCGTANAACKGCAVFNASYFCNVSFSSGASVAWFDQSPRADGTACGFNNECASGVCSGGVCGGGGGGGECGTGCFMNENGCCQNNSTCFVAGTQITMADGTTRAIETLAMGDEIMAYDEQLHKTVPSHVTHTFVHENTDGTVLVNGRVRATPNHPFYANGKWVRADELQDGDQLMSIDANTANGATAMAVSSLSSMSGGQTVYNLEVDTQHTYFAGGLLVHNKLPVCDCEL